MKGPSITALDHAEARDTEIVFRALLACKGRFDARLILDESAATLTALKKAGRIKPKPGTSLKDCRVEIVAPAMYVLTLAVGGAFPFAVMHGRRICDRTKTREEADRRLVLYRTHWLSQRGRPLP